MTTSTPTRANHDEIDPSTPAPERVIWRSHGFEIRLDEDGVSFAHGSWAIEQCELLELLEVIHTALACASTGAVPAPQRPTREQIEQMSYRMREEEIAKRARRAIEAEFAHAEVPF